MRFAPALEAAYRIDQFRDSLKFLRINLAMLLVVVLAVVQVDRIVMPGFTETVPVFARLGVMLPILIVALALSFLRRAPIWYPRVITAFMTVAMMAIAWIGLLAWSQGEDRVFVRLIIVTVAVYFVMGLRFRLALFANLLTLVFYAVAAQQWGMSTMVLTQFLSMLAITSLVCAAGAYNLEHARRTAWLEGRLLAEIALRDGLTGIHNRRRLDEHLQRMWQQAIRERKHVAMLFADIDSFKPFNDCYGHQTGDEALKRVAEVLANFGRRPLDMAARFGGEEFAVVLFDTDCEQGRRIAEQVRSRVRELAIPHAESPVAPVLTISIGVACLQPELQRDPTALFQMADQALYMAKNDGGDRVHVVDSKQDEVAEGYYGRHLPADTLE